MPTNTIVDSIWYISEDSKDNQRLIIDVPCENPNVWQVSKVERVNRRGTTKLTLYQTERDQHTDYIEKDAEGNIIGMWADYYSSTVTPVSDDSEVSDTITAEITTTNNTIKVGGSYKLLTVKFYDKDGIEITDRYSSSIKLSNWTCSIDGVDVTHKNYISWLEQPNFNQIKIKVADDRTLLTKVLNVTCTVSDIVGTIQLELSI